MSENPFKSLAGQTVVYGLGTILPRLLNYLLVPLYTRVFLPEIYGQFTELYAYIALLMALLTYGMETTFFRHAQDSNFLKVYGNIMTSILTTTGVFVAAVVCLHPFIADIINYQGREVYFLFLGLIAATDAITAVPFCMLRKYNKAGRFSVIKIINVCTNVGLNVLFLVVMRDTSTRLANQWFGPQAGLLTWVFICNLIASLVNVLLLLPELSQIKLQRDRELMRKLLNYALPIMLINLVGMVNEVADKIVVRYMVPDKATAMAQLGIYGANYKLAVLMTIFVQMFRFASEPFFFNRAKDRNSPALFADVMTYFVICGLIIFLGVTLYIDIFGYILCSRGGAYREGLGIVPIVLIANLFYGVVFNLSMWYKLIDRTRCGTVITIIGASVTMVCLIGLVPIIGYWGAALAHLGCYTTMMIVSYVWGQKVHPFPYNIKRMLLYFFIALGLYALSALCKPANTALMYIVNTFYLLAFIAFAFLNEHRYKRTY